MKPTTLRECPFCGGEAERLDFETVENDPNAGGCCITCKRCGASSPVHFDRKENLYSSWDEKCPFCGGETERLYFETVENDPNAGGCCITCKRCGASSPVHFDRKENLYSSWDERWSDHNI